MPWPNVRVLRKAVPNQKKGAPPAANKRVLPARHVDMRGAATGVCRPYPQGRLSTANGGGRLRSSYRATFFGDCPRCSQKARAGGEHSGENLPLRDLPAAMAGVLQRRACTPAALKLLSACACARVRVCVRVSACPRPSSCVRMGVYVRVRVCARVMRVRACVCVRAFSSCPRAEGGALPVMVSERHAHMSLRTSSH